MGNFYLFISTAFSLLVLISNIISVKFISLPFCSLVIPVGLLFYPLSFVLNDFVTEIYGERQARQMIYTALIMNVLGYFILQFSLALPSSDLENEEAFQKVFKLSGMRIFSSLCAYLIAHLLDIQIYLFLMRRTHYRFLWLRNNGATWISQGIDTFLVDFLYLCGGLKMSLATVWPIMLFAYLYKIFFCIATTPLLYFLVYLKKRLHVSKEI